MFQGHSAKNGRMGGGGLDGLSRPSLVDAKAPSLASGPLNLRAASLEAPSSDETWMEEKTLSWVGR
jgi:hypothetical protein